LINTFLPEATDNIAADTRGRSAGGVAASVGVQIYQQNLCRHKFADTMTALS
jgi:hypothetical protein